MLELARREALGVDVRELLELERTLVIAEEGDEAVVPFADEVIYVPATSQLLAPLLTVVPLQVFALWLSTAKGLDVDQPRNLAKSVTVE